MVIGSKSGHRLSAPQMVAALKIINPPSPDHTGHIGIGISGKEKEPSKGMKITRSRQPRELVSVPLMYAWRLVILLGGGPLRCDVVRYGTGEGADTYLYTN